MHSVLNTAVQICKVVPGVWSDTEVLLSIKMRMGKAAQAAITDNCTFRSEIRRLRNGNCLLETTMFVFCPSFALSL